MQLRWTSHLKKKEDKDEFKKHLLTHPLTLNRLTELLQQDLETVLRDSSDEHSFTYPAWAEYQAYKMGEAARLKKIISLITVSK